MMYLNILITFPNYIKVDVDGIENLVLSGGINTIYKAKSILIEVTKEFQSQSLGVQNILESLDFELINEFKTSELHIIKFGIRRFNEIYFF